MRSAARLATETRRATAPGRPWVLCLATLALALGLGTLATGAAVTLGAEPTPGAAAGLAAEPTAGVDLSPATLAVLEGGDPRSEGEGPGLVGSPLAILLGVIGLGIATAAITAVIVLVTRRDR